MKAGIRHYSLQFVEVAVLEVATLLYNRGLEVTFEVEGVNNIEAPQFENWTTLKEQAQIKLTEQGFSKPIAPATSLMADNLREVLSFIKGHYKEDESQIKNILFYLYRGETVGLSTSVGGNQEEDTFRVVVIDYSEPGKEKRDNFIRINL